MKGTSSILNKPIIQAISTAVDARLLFSFSTELLEIMDYFFEFYDIKEFSYLTKYPMVDLQLLTQDPELLSQQACKGSPVNCTIRRTPKPSDCFTYLTTLITVVKCDILGDCMN